jgi:hypothetical protein
MYNTELIKHYDEFNIIDVIKEKKLIKNSSPFLGLVRIFENNVLNVDESKDGWLTNMTIATGREFAAQSLFKKSSPNSLFGDVTNYKVDAFGIGSGGSVIDVNNNVTLLGPELCDIGLYSPISINSQCLQVNDNTNNVKPNVVKFIESAGPGSVPGTIEFEISSSADFSNCNLNYYTVVKSTCVIDHQEPSMLNPGESIKVDEAMLFLTSTQNTNPRPFAHICFAPKFIELETIFKIEWYVIF